MSLYQFIKKENKDLYTIINRIDAKKIFDINKNTKLTFFMPNQTLTLYLKEHLNEALDILKKLFIYGYYKTKSDLYKTKTPYILYSRQFYDDPTQLDIEHNKAYKSKNIIVYNLLNNSLPMTRYLNFNEVPLNERETLTKTILKFKNTNSFRNTIISLLEYLKKTDIEVYDAVCLLLDNDNIIISYYIIIEQFKKTNKIISDELFTDWINNHYSLEITDNEKPILDASNYIRNKYITSKHMTFITNAHTKLLASICNKNELPKNILDEYNNFIIDNHLPSHLVKLYKNDPYLKPFQDELRFLYYKPCTSDFETLNQINWNDTKISLNILDIQYNSLITKELYYDGIITFVRSIYLLYMPIEIKKK